MRILLTGANGCVGHAVLNFLSSQPEYELWATARQSIKSNMSNVKSCKFDITSLTDAAYVVDRCKTADAFVHIASAIKSPSPGEIIATNCHGMFICLDVAHRLGVKKFIYISSIQVIGKPTTPIITEEHPVTPQTTYHITKFFGEQVLFLPKNLELSPIILRISSPIGEGMNPSTIVPIFLRTALRNETIFVYGTGKREQNYVDVKDIAFAVHLALQSKKSGVYNIAGKTCISNLDLAILCKTLVCSKSNILLNQYPDPEESQKWNISLDKAEHDLSFIPKYDLSESLKAIKKII